MQEETRANRYLVPRGDEPYESLLEIKRSEFIGHIKRVSTVEERAPTLSRCARLTTMPATCARRSLLVPTAIFSVPLMTVSLPVPRVCR